MQAGEAIYTKDWNGLMQCYTLAIPFYRNSLLATLVLLPMIVLTYRLWVIPPMAKPVAA
jgi:hypothetical protein